MIAKIKSLPKWLEIDQTGPSGPPYINMINQSHKKGKRDQRKA